MSEAETTAANPPEEVKAETSVEEQKPKEEPSTTETTEEPAATEESATKEEPTTKEEPASTEAKKEDDAADTSNVLKTKGKIDYDNLRNNNKFDPSTREVTDDPNAIRKQVEFYFGDWNFPQDKFMWESAEGTENKPIPVSKIHSFKRMRVFQPYSAVVAALRDSTFLVVEGEEGSETIKRKVAYKPVPTAKAQAEAATVYVKGFGDEKPDTQFDLESFFSEYGDVKGLKLRRTNEGFFKGSAFVTFASEEEAKQFIEYKPAPKWKDHDLKIMSKHAYCQEKSDLIKEGKLEPNQNPRQKKFYEGRDGTRGGRGGFRGDSNDWKKRRDHDQKNGFRGGRGRGRGGRGGRGRGGDRFRDRDDRSRENKERAEAGDKDAAASSNNKRAREDDGPAQEPAAKKVDVKDA